MLRSPVTSNWSIGPLGEKRHPIFWSKVFPKEISTSHWSGFSSNLCFSFSTFYFVIHSLVSFADVYHHRVAFLQFLRQCFSKLVEESINSFKSDQFWRCNHRIFSAPFSAAGRLTRRANGIATRSITAAKMPNPLPRCRWCPVKWGSETCSA